MNIYRIIEAEARGAKAEAIWASMCPEVADCIEVENKHTITREFFRIRPTTPEEDIKWPESAKEPYVWGLIATAYDALAWAASAMALAVQNGAIDNTTPCCDQAHARLASIQGSATEMIKMAKSCIVDDELIIAAREALSDAEAHAGSIAIELGVCRP